MLMIALRHGDNARKRHHGCSPMTEGTMEFSSFIRVAALAMQFALVASADTLILKNGAQYSGVFVSGDRDRVTFDTDNKGARTFYARDIDRIIFSSEESGTPLPS